MWLFPLELFVSCVALGKVLDVSEFVSPIPGVPVSSAGSQKGRLTSLMARAWCIVGV